MNNDLLPTISVVVPVLNNKNGLRQCLDSVISQQYEHLEIAVIDGGSSDGTLEVISDFEHVIAYTESNQDRGISDAFNRGIKATTGELVAVLNSDDFWTGCTIKILLEAIERNPVGDIYSGQIRFVDSSTGRSYLRSPDLRRMERRMNLFHPALFVRRSCYDQVGMYSEDYQFAMDADWCHRAMKSNVRFAFVDGVLANMVLGGKSDVHYKKSLEEYRRSLVNNDISGPFLAGCYFYVGCLMKWLTSFYFIRLAKQLVLR